MSNLTIEEKLKNLPRIYVNSIEKNELRREVIRSQFYNLGIENYSFFITTPWQDRCRVVTGDKIGNVDPRIHLVTAAYFEAIKHWYETTNEEYALFFEDDVFLETVRYWNFTWNDFIAHLPPKWEVIHLGTIYMMHPSWDYTQLDNNIRKSTYYDSCQMSLIRRSHAKALIDRHIKGENLYDFTPPFIPEKPDADPYGETLLYMSTEESYRFMLFTENPYYAINSSFRSDYPLSFGSETFPVTMIAPMFTNKVIKWWQNIGSQKSISELMVLSP